MSVARRHACGKPLQLNELIAAQQNRRQIVVENLPAVKGHLRGFKCLDSIGVLCRGFIRHGGGDKALSPCGKTDYHISRQSGRSRERRCGFSGRDRVSFTGRGGVDPGNYIRQQKRLWTAGRCIGRQGCPDGRVAWYLDFFKFSGPPCEDRGFCLGVFLRRVADKCLKTLYAIKGRIIQGLFA